MLQPIRQLITRVVVGALVATGALVGVSKLAPSPAPKPAVSAPAATAKPKPKTIQVYDKPARYIVMHHQGGTAWTVPIQAKQWFASQHYEDVAYNAMITPKGEVWQGRDEKFMSAANLGINAQAVAFCLLGDLNRTRPTDAQLLAAGHWVRLALQRHPGARLIQHKDVARITGLDVGTECPGAMALRMNAARAVFLIASGYTLQEAKARAAAGR